MHVHPEPMGKSMDEIGHTRIRTAEVTRMVPHVVPGDAVEGSQGGTGTHGINGRLLGSEYQVIKRSLPRGKAARNRDRPGDVGTIVPELCPDILDDELTGPGLAPIVIVMQSDRIGARRHDGGKANPLRPPAPEGVLDQGLQL